MPKYKSLRDVPITKGALEELADLPENEQFLVGRSPEDQENVCDKVGKGFWKKYKKEILEQESQEVQFAIMQDLKQSLHGGFIVRMNKNPDPTFKLMMGRCRPIAIASFVKEGMNYAETTKKSHLLSMLNDVYIYNVELSKTIEKTSRPSKTKKYKRRSTVQKESPEEPQLIGRRVTLEDIDNNPDLTDEEKEIAKKRFIQLFHL